MNNSTPALHERARVYATEAHQRINHRRKYNNDPYDVHLSAVAKLVTSVTADAEMIAAGWLHDTVEDTQATLEDIEEVFGKSVAELVEELTDVSKPGDGNRAVRKAIDCRHLAQASQRAKTVKLADLIDNCKDITRHDPRFAQVYLAEMSSLLDVLQEGDLQLFKRAKKLHARSIGKLEIKERSNKDSWASERLFQQFRGVTAPNFKRIFVELFTAMDIAEPLLSFGLHDSCSEAKKVMTKRHEIVASVRNKGTVQGYIRLQDLHTEECVDILRHFTSDQVINDDSTLADVIHVLTRHDFCFIAKLGEVFGVICRDDINKPVVRMWLFGLITLIEMRIVQVIQEQFPDDTWQPNLTADRLEKAKALQIERQRRNQHCPLIDCLQLSDKGRIIVENAGLRELFSLDSKANAKRLVKSLESLRNNLAHAQDIVAHDWAQIARLSLRIEEFPED
jgi:hypothetical protein